MDLVGSAIEVKLERRLGVIACRAARRGNTIATLAGLASSAIRNVSTALRISAAVPSGFQYTYARIGRDKRSIITDGSCANRNEHAEIVVVGVHFCFFARQNPSTLGNKSPLED